MKHLREMRHSAASSSAILSTGRTWTCGAGPDEGWKNVQRDGAEALLEGEAERVGILQSGDEKLPRRPCCGPFST